MACFNEQLCIEEKRSEALEQWCNKSRITYINLPTKTKNINGIKIVVRKTLQKRFNKFVNFICFKNVCVNSFLTTKNVYLKSS